jgi:LPS-assembly protein
LKHLQNYAKVTQLNWILSRLHRFLKKPYSDHLVSSKYLIIASGLLVLPHAHAAEPAACETSLDPLSADSLLPISSSTSDSVIEFEVGDLEVQFGLKPTARMGGGVILRRGDKVVGAESARFDLASRSLLLEGDVRYEDLGTRIRSDFAEFAYDSGRVRFEGAEFSLGASNAHGTAEAVEINEQGRLELDGVTYTTCPPGSNDWVIEADDIDLDTRQGVGTARGMKLRFKGIPILVAPYLSFPIGDARKSGILTPEFGSTQRSGTELRVPYYFNLAPNYDATITPRLLTDRGLQMQTKFRYLTESMDGQINADYLPNDEIFNDSRAFASWKHRLFFAGGWRNRIDISGVSDDQYFEDLGGSLSVSSITHLDRNINFDYYTDHLSFFAQVQDYQTLDEAITPVNEPYQRVPQILVRGVWPQQWLGLQFGFTSELVNFDRDVGVTGWRLNLVPEVALPISRPGWFVKPAVALDYTRYDLSNTAPGQSTDPVRTVPIASLDFGQIFERTMKNSARVQTIEPRVLYAYVPFREQADLPVFDTIMPDFNLVQLYRTNRFLGVDRIADTDQVSIGVTSRIIDVITGRELVSATIGQARYFSESNVALPGQPIVSTESSDYIAEISFLIKETINFNLGQQWGASGDGTTQSEARFQYRPASNKILNLAYRFRRDSLEQGDISLAWPLGSKWNIVGRYNYSFRDDEALEKFIGFEYASCCWGIRLVARRFISTRDGTQDSSIGLQLVLKGMTSVGTAADKLLERGILGYSTNYQ